MRGKGKGQAPGAPAPQKNQIIISWRTCTRLMVSIFVLYLCVTCWRPIASLIWHMVSAAAPLFLGFAIAYVVNILMMRYEKWYFPRSTKALVNKSRRAVCLIGAIVTLIGAVVVLLLIIIPQLVNAITVITKKVPARPVALMKGASGCWRISLRRSLSMYLMRSST